MNEAKGKEVVSKIVNEWTKVYIIQIFFLTNVGNVWQYEVEFSKPKQIKPIPEGTAKVYFSVMEVEGGQSEVEFNFENESLKHRIGITMRGNMYESWVDNVLAKKLTIKTELHLGSEFEHTRFVDSVGKAVDPFVPQFDIAKVKNFSSQKKNSQEINVESPRFVSTLKRALEEMFLLMDKDKSGCLDYNEFREAFKTLSYGLNDNDINMMIALADENKDEKIVWAEFIPTGIDAIKNIYTRNIVKKKAELLTHPDPEALKLVYWDEIKSIYRLLSYKFNKVDTVKDGSISLQHFKNVVRSTKFLTPKEKNLLIRLQKSNTVKFADFPEMLYNVRYEIASSEIMEQNLDTLESHIRREMARDDKDDDGIIQIKDAEKALARCKQINLTSFQIHVVLGLSDCDGDGIIQYKYFAKVAAAYIEESYTFETQLKKHEIMKKCLEEEETDNMEHP